MHLHWPVWSHDSRYIFFNYSISTANREPAEIYRVAADGSMKGRWVHALSGAHGEETLTPKR